MNIKKTRQWREADKYFSQLHARSAFSIIGSSPMVGGTMNDVDFQFAEILELCPQYYPVWFTRAELMLRTGSTETGEKYLDDAFRYLMEVETDEDEFCHVLSLHIEALDQLLRYDLALKILEKAVRVFPEAPTLYDDLAFYTLQVNPKEASKAFGYEQKALELDPDNDEFLNNMGWLYLITGDVRKADEYFRKAVDYNSGNEIALENQEMVEHMLQHHGMDYPGYLLRPVNREELKESMDYGDHREARDYCALFNADRLEAFKFHHLSKGTYPPGELLNRIKSIQLFLEIVEEPIGPADQVFLAEDLDSIRNRMGEIIRLLLEDADYMDEHLLSFMGNSVIAFYDFLVQSKLSSSYTFEGFKKDLKELIQRVTPRLEDFYHQLHDVTLSQAEREQRLAVIVG